MNEPAFPAYQVKRSPSPMGSGEIETVIHGQGMSLRDYFAAKALQGILANADEANGLEFVQAAYAYADAMLKERAKSPSLH